MTQPAANQMQNWSIYILIFLGVWLLVISFFLFRFFTLYKKLTKGVQEGDIKKILEKILTRGEENAKNLNILTKRVDEIVINDKRHIQKVGLVRFNPFSELGGDHSFCLSILDDRDTGVVITCLHARDRTRMYMKDIINGRSSFELSAEEKKAISNAQKGK